MPIDLSGLVGDLPPNIQLILAGLLALLAVTLVAASMIKARSRAELRAAEAALFLLRAEIGEARATAMRELGARSAAEARLAEARMSLDAMEAERDDARRMRDDSAAAAALAETAAVLARQQLADIRRQMADWEATKAAFLAQTQAGVLATAQQISSKLLEDHKRETAEARRQGEEQVKATTDALLRQVAEVAGHVQQMQGVVTEKAQALDVVMRALSSPGGAGHFAEIGLANTLKSFGLVQGRDFELQHTIYGEEGGRLRPDAVVFLPSNSVMVIDSKASKFLLELAAAEGTPAEAEAYQALARSMSLHLRQLADRDYRNAILAGYRRAGRSGEISRAISVMYLPNEGALEKLHRADPEFWRRAADLQIIPAGPAGLACTIGFASVEISLMRQVENQRRIVDTTRALIDNLGVALGYAAKIGSGLKSAADNYARFGASVNRNLLSKARILQQYGIQPSRPIPGNLGTYQVTELGGDALIEGEVAEAEPAKLEATLL